MWIVTKCGNKGSCFRESLLWKCNQPGSTWNSSFPERGWEIPSAGILTHMLILINISLDYRLVAASLSLHLAQGASRLLHLLFALSQNRSRKKIRGRERTGYPCLFENHYRHNDYWTLCKLRELGVSKSDKPLNEPHLAGHKGTHVHELEAVHACFLIKQSCACSGVVAISSQTIPW